MIKSLPAKQEMQEISVQGQEDPLEKDMVSHFSILPWKIPRRAWRATVHGVAKESGMT